MALLLRVRICGNRRNVIEMSEEILEWQEWIEA